MNLCYEPECETSNYQHTWREVYYGYKCEACGEFIPHGCEPWAQDGNVDDGLETWEESS